MLNRITGTIYVLPKSATTNDKTLIRCDKEVDHRSNRKSRFFEDWHTHPWQKDYFVD